MTTTAKHGNPADASRGAAVSRAKQELGDALDDRLFAVNESARLCLLARVVGCPVDRARACLDAATIGALTQWLSRVKTTSVPTLAELVDARVVVDAYIDYGEPAAPEAVSPVRRVMSLPPRRPTPCLPTT